jgi:hypothetical protein
MAVLRLWGVGLMPCWTALEVAFMAVDGAIKIIV